MDSTDKAIEIKVTTGMDEGLSESGFLRLQTTMEVRFPDGSVRISTEEEQISWDYLICKLVG